MSYQDLVVDNRSNGTFRVHRSLMTSADVYAREREALFSRCWLYVGHDSEVPKAGDYVRRQVGGRPLIFLRDSAGAVRIHFNTCTHRGATLCREDTGNARIFQCFYHAWSFDTTGKLVVTPGADAYGPGFDKSELGLKAPAHVEHYRGLYFVNYDPNATVDLHTYLAGAIEYLDLVLDQGEQGMRIVEGSHRYSVKSNWKLMLENSIDGYHAPTVHATYIDFVKDSGGGSASALEGGRAYDLGNGHAVLESPAAWARPIAYWEPFFGEDSREEITQTRARLIAQHGKQRGLRMAETFRNLMIFPNLIINDVAAITIRRIEPTAADHHSLEAWAFAPVEEKAGSAALERRLDSFLTFLGPGGFASPDDVEALESCQKGYGAEREVPWSDISRGMTRPAASQDELPIRTFWRAYAALLDGLDFPPRETAIEAPDASSPSAGETSQPTAMAR